MTLDTQLAWLVLLMAGLATGIQLRRIVKHDHVRRPLWMFGAFVTSVTATYYAFRIADAIPTVLVFALGRLMVILLLAGLVAYSLANDA